MIAERKSGFEAELQLFGSHGRADVRKRNFTFWQLKQSVSGEAELLIFDSQCRAEVRKRNFTS